MIPVIEAHFQLSPQLLEENFGRSLRRWRTQDRTQWAETPLDFPKDQHYKGVLVIQAQELEIDC